MAEHDEKKAKGEKDRGSDLTWEDVIEVPEGVDKAAVADWLSMFGTISRKNMQAAADGIPEHFRAWLEAQMAGVVSGVGAQIQLAEVGGDPKSAAIVTPYGPRDANEWLESEGERAAFRRVLAEQCKGYRAELLRLATRTPEPTPLEIAACDAALKHAGDTGKDARAPLLATLRAHLVAWQASEWEVPADCAIHHLDEDLARYLKARLGAEGDRIATAIRNDALERMAAYIGTAAQVEAMKDQRMLWKLWALPDTGEPLVRGLMLLTLAAWVDVVRPELERANPPKKGEPVSYSVHVEVGEEEYVGVGKPAGAMSWAFGGVGKELDGSEYTPQPGFSAAIVSRTWDAIPERRRQRQFPFTEDGRRRAGLAMVRKNWMGRPRARKHVLSCTDGKLVLVMCSSVHPEGRARWVRADDLAREMYPNAPRIQKRDREAVVKAMWRLKPLHLVLPDSRALQCFDLVAPMDPARVTPDMLLSYAYGPSLFDACFGPDPTFPRFFVLNKTAALSIPGDEGPKLRALVRASDMWDRAFDAKTHRFKAEFLPTFIAETWAAEINAMDRSDRRLRAKARDLVNNDLDALHEAGHVIVERLRGPGKRFKIRPPKAWEEAREAIRKKLQRE